MSDWCLRMLQQVGIFAFLTYLQRLYFINNFVVPQVLVSERNIAICTQVKITRARHGDYLGLPWAPGHEQGHRLFAEGGMHSILCFGSGRIIEDLFWFKLHNKSPVLNYYPSHLHLGTEYNM